MFPGLAVFALCALASCSFDWPTGTKSGGDGGKSTPDAGATNGRAIQTGGGGSGGGGGNMQPESGGTSAPGTDGGTTHAIDSGATMHTVHTEMKDAETDAMTSTSCKTASGTTMDGCCPAGANANLDVDCKPTCGNGAIELGETCEPPSQCPTLASCTSDNACLTPKLVGSADKCTAKCELVPVTECKNGDSCCAPSCLPDDDNDCSQTCGDGEVDPPLETCEPTSASEPCPSSCDDQKPCTTDVTTGAASSCNVACSHSDIVAPANGDQCCPSDHGANALNDDDCDPVCGNGAVESGEECDGNCPTSCPSQGCNTYAVQGSDCARKCVMTGTISAASGTTADGCCPSGATHNNDTDCAVMCGNGAVEEGELCDGNCPTSCANQGCTKYAVSGSSCTRQCVISGTISSASGSTADGCCPSGQNHNTDTDCSASCGNGAIEQGELCDGDCPTSCSNQGCTKYLLQGSNCTRTCATNGTITAASGNTSDACCPSGANNNTDTDCAVVCGNSVIEDGEVCDGNCPTSCSNQGCTKYILQGSSCTRQCATNGTITTASGSTADSCCPSGQNHNADVDCAVVCGNGAKETGEDCDDGNKTSSDGCSSSCKYDNNTSTPGDDRPGYVYCGPSLTCNATQQCSTDNSTYNCSGSLIYKTDCDGPEDCPSNMVCCYVEDGDTQCRTSSNCPFHSGEDILCHRTADCVLGGTCMTSSTHGGWCN